MNQTMKEACRLRQACWRRARGRVSIHLDTYGSEQVAVRSGLITVQFRIGGGHRAPGTG